MRSKLTKQKWEDGITEDTALRLNFYFDTSPEFWLGLQADFDLEEALNIKKSFYFTGSHYIEGISFGTLIGQTAQPLFS